MLRASAARWVWVLIGCMVFVAFGLGLAFGERTGSVATAVGVVLIAVFGFSALVALRQLVTPGSLVIGRSAFDVIRRGTLTTYEFAECGPFTTWRNPSRGTTYVVFDHLPDPDTATNRENRAVMRGSRLLPDSYGMPAQALADLLEDVRRAATGDRR